MAFACNFW